MKKSGTFLYNAFLLIAVSLVMRTVGMYFNVYISNKVGAQAMGVYSLIGGVYGFGITLATSGINLAVTRLISEALGKGNRHESGEIIKLCLIYAACFGLLASVLLFSLSGKIAYVWLDDLRTVRPLKILSLSLPFISVTSALNGYFTAMRKIYKNALTVFIEQGVRISCTVLLLTVILPSGIEYACIALAAGSSVAELVSLIIMSSLYLLDRDRRDISASVSRQTSPARHARGLFAITLPVAFSSYIRAGLLTIEHAMIPAGLKKHGASAETSLAIYGTMHSMVFPVVLFPAVFLTSFAGLLVPELSESRAAGDSERIKRIVSRIMRLTMIFSIGTGAIMLCFAQELGATLYSTSEFAGIYIRLLAPLIPVMYLDSMTDVMLKGLGQQFYSMTVNIADSILSVLLVWLWLPRRGIYGYIIIIYVCELLNASLSIARLIHVSRVKADIINWIIKPLAAALGATSFTRLIFGLLGGGYPAVALCAAIISAILIYLLLLYGLYALPPDDIRRLGLMLARLSGKGKYHSMTK